MSIPVIAFSAYSGTGKTTLVEKIIRNLKQRGLRVAVIKHDAHHFEIDHEGKDTWRFANAGADTVIISSSEKTARIDRITAEEKSVHELIAGIRDADIILVEGYKHEKLPRIGICRKATGKGFTAPMDSFIAVVTDTEIQNTDIPSFGLEDIDEISEFIMEQTKDFTHFNNEGRAKMVDVGEKPVTNRTAVAAGRVLVNEDTFRLIKSGGIKKGDVLTVAQIAGVMGAKRTPDIIPMCHPVLMNGIDLSLSLCEERLSVEITASVECSGKTGVEMEALTAVSIAALTVYDMCKAVQKDMVISDIRLLEKHGGVHGDFFRKD